MAPLATITPHWALMLVLQDSELADRYALHHELGRGACGVVYQAYDRLRQATVALKIVAAFEPQRYLDLKGEFRVRATLDHPSLLELYELHVRDKSACLTMRLVAGGMPITHALASIRGVDSPASREAFVDFDRFAIDVLQAVAYLHAQGLVHRDVKPHNVLVDEGRTRALLADFGLATRQGRRAGVAGTLAYLAPEAWGSEPIGPSSDIYSVGVTLAEALLGRPPLAGAIRSEEDLPSWLPSPHKKLLVGLLTADPHRRMTLDGALHLLEGLDGRRVAPLRRARKWDLFVGRESEIEALEHALTGVRPRPRLCVLRGHSGIGKSTLVRRVLARFEDTDSHQILRGRCHPQEQVNMRAWDEISDQIADCLSARAFEVRASSVEMRAAARLFPTLRRLPGHEDPPVELSHAPSGREELMAAVRVFRDLLGCVADRPTIVWVDDLHWAGRDDIDLLMSLVEFQLENVTIVVSLRPEAVDGDVKTVLERHADWDLTLDKLDAASARRLAEEMGVASEQLSTRELDALRTLPMLVLDIAEQHGQRIEGDLTEALIASRMKRHEGVGQQLLELVAASPAPLSWALIQEATRQADGLFQAFLAMQRDHLLTEVLVFGEPTVEVYHDVVRQAHLREHSKKALVDAHLRLARAYESVAPTSHDLKAHHLEAGGQVHDAALEFERAARMSVEHLRFSTAKAQLDRVEALDPALARTSSVCGLRADVDASLGLSRLAGTRFLQAAAIGTEEGGHSEDIVGYRMRGARELIRCGDPGAGLSELQRVLRGFGIRLPSGPRSTILWSSLLRLRILLQGIGLRPTRLTPTPTSGLQLDVLWAGCSSLSHVNHSLADVLLLRHLILAERGGDESALIRSLSFEAVAECTIGVPFLERRVDRLLARARDLCERHGTNYDWAWLDISLAARATFEARWADAIEHGFSAERRLDDIELGIEWERSINRTYLAIALAMRGDVGALRELVDTARRSALHRDDDVALAGVSAGHPAVIGLVDDAAESPYKRLDRSKAWPHAAYSSADYYRLVAAAERHLYRGEGRAAYEVLLRDWPKLSAGAFLALRFVGVDAKYLRARAALAYDGGERDARRQYRTLRKSTEPIAQAYAAAIAAALNARGLSVLGSYASAAAAFDRLGMSLHAASARTWEPASSRGARATLERLGAKAPDKLAALLVPPPL